MMSKQVWFGIIGLLLIVAMVRMVGIAYGQPHPIYLEKMTARGIISHQSYFQPDEYELVAIPLRMAVEGRWNLDYVNYGLMTTLNQVTFILTGAHTQIDPATREGLNTREYAPFPLYVMGRWYAALSGVVAVAVTFALARSLGGTYAGFVAGGLSAVAMTLVQHAHYVTGSTLASAWVMVCLWAVWRALSASPQRWRWLLLAGVSAGLATASRNNAGWVGLVVLVLGGWILIQRLSWVNLVQVGLMYLAVMVGLVIGIPQLLVAFGQFWDGLLYGARQYLQGEGVQATVPPLAGLWYQYRYLIVFNLGIPATLLAIYEFVLRWRRVRDAQRVFLLFMMLGLGAYSVVVLPTMRPDGADQMLIPVIPVWAIWTGLGAAHFAQNNRMGQALLALCVWLPSTALTLQLLPQFTQPDTRDTAQAWVYENVPRDSRIYLLYSYNVALDPTDYPQEQRFGTRLSWFDEPPTGEFDYLIVSDAVLFFAERAPELFSQSYREQVTAYRQAISSAYPRLFHVPRRTSWGHDWMGNTATYWHNPAISVYCLKDSGC